MEHGLLNYFNIKKGIHGEGVFANIDIKKDEIILIMNGPIIELPTYTSVQLGYRRHIEDNIAAKINHSCFPSTQVLQKSASLISIKDIFQGEEITFNYNKNEDFLARPFICHCCGQKITGKKVIVEKHDGT